MTHARVGRSLQDVNEGGVPGEGGNPPPLKPEKWIKLMELVHFIWKNSTIPIELGWTILILISKGNTDT